MTKIVKSAAVVEDRGADKAPLPVLHEAPKPAGVIKRRHIEHGFPVIQPQRTVTLDSGAEELNRLRVEIKQAKDELKALGREKKDLLRADAERASAVIADASSIEAAEKSAVWIIQNAEAEAAGLLAAAKAEGVHLAEEAHNNGYLEGFSKGYEEATQEFRDENTPRAVAIADLLDALSEYYDEMMAKHEDNIVDLAMAVARKILDRALSEDPRAVADMLRAVVQENNREEYVKITLSPELLPIKAKVGEKIRRTLEELSSNVTIQVDYEAAPGTAVIETPKGIVDASIQTQLENLTKVIKSE